jgi:hypothetical protein
MVFKVLMEHRGPQAHRVSLDHKAPLAILALKALTEHKELRVHRAQLVQQEHRALQVTLEHKEQMVHKEPLVRRELLEHKV